MDFYKTHWGKSRRKYLLVSTYKISTYLYKKTLAELCLDHSNSIKGIPPFLALKKKIWIVFFKIKFWCTVGHHYTFYFDLILNLLQIYWNKNIELRPTFRTRYVKPNKLHILEHQFTYQSAENLNFVKICVVENKFLRKRCSMNWVFLNFSVIPNLHALFIFVILFKTVFFQHVTGRLCFSARFAQSDDVNYMNFRYTMASI